MELLQRVREREKGGNFSFCEWQMLRFAAQSSVMKIPPRRGVADRLENQMCLLSRMLPAIWFLLALVSTYEFSCHKSVFIKSTSESCRQTGYKSRISNALNKYTFFAGIFSLDIFTFCLEAYFFRLEVLYRVWNFKGLDPRIKVPPGGLVVRIITPWKNPSTSAGFEHANLGSRAYLLINSYNSSWM